MARMDPNPGARSSAFDQAASGHGVSGLDFAVAPQACRNRGGGQVSVVLMDWA